MTTTDLEHTIDAAVYEALLQTSPRLVDAIRDLLALGVPPATIECHVMHRLGGETQTVRNVRHVAEHIKRHG